MKKISIVLAIIIVVLGFIDLKATDSKLGIKGEKTFQLNEKINQPLLKFISTAPLEDIEGYVKDFQKIESTAKLDPSNIESLTGMISFPVKSLKTGISSRDRHLYSSTWMDADKYPNITFEIKKIKDVKLISSSKGKAVIELIINGDFSMHGKSKNIDVKSKITYLKESKKTRKRASGDLLFVEGKFEIALKDFGVTGKKGIVGSKVVEIITIEFSLYYNSK